MRIPVDLLVTSTFHAISQAKILAVPTRWAVNGLYEARYWLIVHDATKRAYALEFGVDLYTDFEPFQERLGKVAQAATAGGLITKVALDVGTEGTMVGTVVTVSSLAAMKDIIKDNPPGQLNELNRSRLEKMGVPSYQIDAFIKNYNYTAMERALLVEALRHMGDIKGREIFIAYATAAPDEVIARYMQQTAEMAANYISDTGPADFVDLAGEPILVTRDGQLVLVSAVDYVVWTQELSDIEEAALTGISDLPTVKFKELLIEGQVDPAARIAFEAQGWKVRDRVGLASREALEKSSDRPTTSPAVVGAGQVVPKP